MGHHPHSRQEVGKQENEIMMQSVEVQAFILNALKTGGGNVTVPILREKTGTNAATVANAIRRLRLRGLLKAGKEKGTWVLGLGELSLAEAERGTLLSIRAGEFKVKRAEIFSCKAKKSGDKEVHVPVGSSYTTQGKFLASIEKIRQQMEKHEFKGWTRVGMNIDCEVAGGQGTSIEIDFLIGQEYTPEDAMMAIEKGVKIPKLVKVEQITSGKGKGKGSKAKAGKKKQPQLKVKPPSKRKKAA